MDNKRFCTKCGKEINGDFLYCPYCGNDLRSIDNNEKLKSNNEKPYKTYDINKALKITLIVLGILLAIVLCLKYVFKINAPDPSQYIEPIKVESETEYKFSCKEYSYDTISRNPESLDGQRAKIRGHVFQVLESGNYCEYIISVTEIHYDYIDATNWEDNIYVKFNRPSNASRVLEDDIVTVYGELDQLYTYTAVSGASITLPLINAKYIVIE